MIIQQELISIGIIPTDNHNRNSQKMATIKFSPQEKAQIITKIQQYFDRELDQDIGQFDADFLLDFFTEQIGGYFYNRGLFDAQQLINERVEQLGDAIYELEQPVN